MNCIVFNKLPQDLFLTDQTKFHLYIIIDFLKQLWFPLISVFLIPSVKPISRIQADFSPKVALGLLLM